MYRILVVDDEPAAIKHISNIISIKCPHFKVTATAEHGQEALKQMEIDMPDVLITDVKMPVMDGIRLVEKVKERYPQVLSLVISGYQEFEYAKAAIKSGVCDYLLKPVKPSVLLNALAGLKERLDEIYSQKRNLIMKSLCEKIYINQEELRRYFPAGRYYAAIVRKQGLPRRYFGNMGFEIFSGKDEKIFLYGRDEMEALYLYPEELLINKSFYQIISETIKKEYKNAKYVTGVIKETSFLIENSDKVFDELYQTLDNNIIIGINQILIIEEFNENKKKKEDKESNDFKDLENLIQNGQKDKILGAVCELFEKMKRGRKTQMHVEYQVRYLLLLLDKYHLLSDSEPDCERTLDEIFYYAEDMNEVSEAIQNIFVQTMKSKLLPKKMDTLEFFEKITDFINRNLANKISMKMLCQEFGVSQTYLNKLFRKYSGCSCNKYLTLTRIERAKEIMKAEDIRYVKDVAIRVGYDDQFYFSRIFTSVVGICPSDYMEPVQNEDKKEDSYRI